MLKTVGYKTIDVPPGMVLVEGGTFKMGNVNKEYMDQQPLHSVTLNSFYISDHEVTQAEWRAVMGNSPSFHKNCDNCPVESVILDEVHEYLDKLNISTNKHYRLPTEAEWEFVARGGMHNDSFKYCGSDDLDVVGWLGTKSGDSTHLVKQKKANSLGVYDMSGNVAEWCEDWYDCYYYSNSPSSNPRGGSSTLAYRVIRGGGWNNDAVCCRTVFRSYFPPAVRINDIGFRVVLSQ